MNAINDCGPRACPDSAPVQILMVRLSLEYPNRIQHFCCSHNSCPKHPAEFTRFADPLLRNHADTRIVSIYCRYLIKRLVMLMSLSKLSKSSYWARIFILQGGKFYGPLEKFYGPLDTRILGTFDSCEYTLVHSFAPCEAYRLRYPKFGPRVEFSIGVYLIIPD